MEKVLGGMAWCVIVSPGIFACSPGVELGERIAAVFLRLARMV